jgi:putative peptide zinc metalloprotease protein
MRQELADPYEQRGFDGGRIDHGVREFAHLKPRLREDLEFTLQTFGNDTSYVIEDRIRSTFYRIGVPEYRFISLLDGSVSIEQALAASAASLGQEAIDAREAAVIVRWLIDNELAFTSASRNLEFLSSVRNRRRRAKTLGRFNLLFIKLPLFNPDRLLDQIMPAFRWMVGRGFLLVWLAVVSTGAYHVFGNWDRFSAGASTFLSVDNWLWIALIWTALKLVHEFFHGLVCKKYQGEVYEAGTILVLFAPIGYVDATSAWRFASKWQRMHTAAAGMYVEFFIAGIAAWVWQAGDAGLVNHLAWNVVVIASVTTLLFNANPLMKFDGYYLFADYVEIPNLYVEGQRFVKYLFRRFMLGIDARLPDRPRRERWIIGVYGLASLLWRILVVATLLFIASTLFHGAGLVIALVSAAIIILVPCARFVRYLCLGNDFERPSVMRFVVTGSLLVAALAGLLTGLQWSREVHAPALVTFADHRTVHAQGEGFVDVVHVVPGQQVHAGQVLLEMSNPDLEAAIGDLELRIRQTEIRIRSHLLEGRQDNVQILSNQRNDLDGQLQDYYRMRDELRVRSPIAGTLVGGRPDLLEHRFVKRGQALADIAVLGRNHLVALIEQQDIEAFREFSGAPVAFAIEGRGASRYPAVLERIEPRATRTVRHEALTALAGGPIGIADVPQAGGGSSLGYLRPRFEAEVSLPSSLLLELREGEIGSVIVRAPGRSLAWHWYQMVNRWMDGVLASARTTV